MFFWGVGEVRCYLDRDTQPPGHCSTGFKMVVFSALPTRPFVQLLSYIYGPIITEELGLLHPPIHTCYYWGHGPFRMITLPTSHCVIHEILACLYFDLYISGRTDHLGIGVDAYGCG